MTNPNLVDHPLWLKPPAKVCKFHNFERTPKEYFAHMEWQEKRYAKGDEQEACPKCGAWLFPEEMNIAKDNPPKLFNDLLSLIETILVDELQVSGMKGMIYKRKIRELRKRSGLLIWK